MNGISIASSGLFAAQRALEVASHNLANVNTPGYSRQVHTQVALESPGVGLTFGRGASGNGVMVTGVDRVTNALVDASLRSNLATSGFQSARAGYLEQAEQLLGPIDGGLFEDLTSFWNAWEDLSLQPDGAAERVIVLDRSEVLASTLNNAAASIDSLIEQAAGEGRSVVEEVNRRASNIASLNQQIVEAGPNTPNGLLDQLDQELDALAELTGATVRHRDDGRVDVSLGGIPIVTGNRSDTLSISGSPAVVTIQDGTTVHPGGRLSGLLSTQGAALAGFRSELDAIAIELRDVVNTAHNAGIDLNGQPGLDLFVGTSALTLGVNSAVGRDQIAASASGQTSDGEVALAIGGLRNFDVAGTNTIDDLARAVLGRLGASARTARSQTTLGAEATRQLRAERASASGVDMDEELSALLRYQRAYEASARALTVMDDALDRLINGTGRVGR